MTSSALRRSPDLALPAAMAWTAKSEPTGRASSILPLTGSEPWAKWAWILAITASFLAVGIAGVSADLGPMPKLTSYQPKLDELAAAGGEAMLMADLAAEPEAAEVIQETPPEVLEVPPPVEAVPDALDLPELAEALVTEDLFVVPTAPKVEEMLRAVDPAPPKPVTRSTPKATPSRPMARSTTGTGQGSGVGSGGAGAGSTGQGTFVIPKPTYPSSLRSLGIQGTVRLQVTVGASGRATSVSIIGTSGNSTLDQYAASWVRRNGKAPPGTVRTFTAPLSFVLR